MTKILTVLLLVGSLQVLAFERLFECETVGNDDVQVYAILTRNFQNSRVLNLDVTLTENDETTFRNFSLTPRRGFANFLRFWGSADLEIDTWPHGPRRLVFGYDYKSTLKIPGLNNSRPLSNVDCTYIGF